MARLEQTSIDSIERRYTGDQIGLLYYLDGKAKGRELDVSAKLHGARTSQYLGEIFARIFR